MRRSRAIAHALAAVALTAAVGCAETASDTDGESVDCRALLSEADCGAAPLFTLDDGRGGSCRWFNGNATTRAGDVCTAESSVGMCLTVGPTQPSCTYTPLEEAYPACVGTPGEGATPAVWVQHEGETVLIDNVCGPSIADAMSGRCGADPASEPAQCECACL